MMSEDDEREERTSNSLIVTVGSAATAAAIANPSELVITACWMSTPPMSAETAEMKEKRGGSERTREA